MIRFVEFMPEEFAEEVDPTELSSQPLGIISLTDPGRQAKLQPGWAAMLRLQFNDVDQEYLDQLDESDRKGKVLFNEQHAKKIVDWVNQNQNKLGGVIVHCWAGISRSGAVAKFIADKFGLPYREGHEEFINQHIYDLLQEADRGKKGSKSMKHVPAATIQYDPPRGRNLNLPKNPEERVKGPRGAQIRIHFNTTPFPRFPIVYSIETWKELLDNLDAIKQEVESKRNGLKERESIKIPMGRWRPLNLFPNNWDELFEIAPEIQKAVEKGLGANAKQPPDPMREHIKTLQRESQYNAVPSSVPRRIKINNCRYRLANGPTRQETIRLNGYLYVPAAGKRQVQLVKEWEKQVENWRTGEPQTQKLKLYKTVDGNEYFVASYSPMVDETQVFPSNKDGTDVDFGAAIGLGVGGEDFEAVWDDTGFEVAR